MEEKKDVWYITSSQLLLETVCFDKPVTKSEAMAMYAKLDVEDIIDSEILGIEFVKDAE